MAYVETFKCDGCGLVKKETNNWFLILAQDSKNGLFYITQIFNYAKAIDYRNDDYMHHACGVECAAKIEARLKAKMQGVTKESTIIPNDLLVADQKIQKAVENASNPMLRLAEDENFD